MFCLNNLITKSISYWHTMTHRQVGSFVWRADSSPVISKGLPTLADKIAMAFGTSKLNNCMVTIFVLKKMYLHGKLFTLIRPLHLMTLWLWKEWLYNKWLTRKTHSCDYLLDFVQFLTRINFVHSAFEDFLSGIKFVKLRQTIHIC